jgi:nitrous oxide reductase accessory protein NosL
MREARHVGALLGVLLAAACNDARDEGPVAVHWSRDVCSHCSMGISDPHHAAQIRLAGARRPALFDDPGCALLWLHDQPGDAVETASFWVRSPDGESWRDARQTRFASDAKTPMDYGFATTEGAPAGSLTLAEVWARIEKAERERRNPRP